MRKRLSSAVRHLKRAEFLVVLLVLVNVGLCVWLYASHARATGRYEEVKVLEQSTLSFKQLSDFFTDIANKKGALYAFDVLRRAPLPPGIDVHLLGHIVGDILYKQQGAKGILSCTQEFRNACSHTIVIGTLLEKGPDSFGEIADLCRQAPGGPGAYTMCFHGLGHGVLAYNDYDLPKAVKMCEKSGTGRGREYAECVGGTIMEMIAGVHNPVAWKQKSQLYFKQSDPLYPCTASFMPNEAKGMCITYITPHLFQMAGADLAAPGPDAFKKAFTFCEPLKDPLRSVCFAGFGKEFTVLAQNRDIRAIDQMSDAQLGTVLDWCALARPEDGKTACMISGLNSIFWGGENDEKAAVRYCALADARRKDSVCTDSFLGSVKYFVNDPARRARICSDVAPDYQDSCRQELL